ALTLSSLSGGATRRVVSTMMVVYPGGAHARAPFPWSIRSGAQRASPASLWSRRHDDLRVFEDFGFQFVPLRDDLNDMILRHGVAGLLQQRVMQIRIKFRADGVDLFEAFGIEDFLEAAVDETDALFEVFRTARALCLEGATEVLEHFAHFFHQLRVGRRPHLEAFLGGAAA